MPDIAYIQAMLIKRKALPRLGALALDPLFEAIQHLASQPLCEFQ